MTDIPPAYVRANGEMLYKLREKHACVLGKLGKVKFNGLSNATLNIVIN